MNYPPVTLIATTYITDQRRHDVANATIHSWLVEFKYDDDIQLHIADDGSAFNSLAEIFKSLCPDLRITESRQERGGYGASLNAGLKKAFETSPLVFLGADDWYLTSLFYLTPWIKALLENESIGCIRLGPPHPNLTGRLEMISDDWQGWGLRLNKGGYAYGDRPALYHKRFFDAYGKFQEGVSALECVRLYDEKVSYTHGPDVVLALPHPFVHLDSPSLSSIEPEQK